MIGEVLASASSDLPVSRPAMWKGQPYFHAGYRPHTTKDGRGIVLQRWRTWCAVCGEAFETTTVREDFGSGNSPTRNCIQHRRAGSVS